MKWMLAALLVSCLACNPVAEERACTPENHCDDTGSTPRCEPRHTWLSPDDPNDYRCIPIDLYDPCDPNPCVTEGRTQCVVSQGTRYCECDDGWHLEGFDCIEDDACFGVTCSNRGSCVTDDDGEAACECDIYYRAEELTCVYAEALDVLPASCGRSGAPALTVVDVAEAGVTPAADMPQEPAIAVTGAGEVWVVYQGAGTVDHLRIANRGPSDVDFQDGPAFETEFNGFSTAFAIGGGRLFLAATGRLGEGPIDEVKAAVRTTGVWERFDLDQNSVAHSGFGRLDISANVDGHGLIAVRRAASAPEADFAWLNDLHLFIDDSFSVMGETSYFCGADAGVVLTAQGDAWSVCARQALEPEASDPLLLSKYGGSLWIHSEIDEVVRRDTWRSFLDAERDATGRLHLLYEGFDTDGDPETSYAIFDPSGEATSFGRFELDFISQAVDFSDGGAVLVLDDEGCPIIVGRAAGSQEVTYLSPRSANEWEIEGLGISSATRIDATWRNGALHLVIVDPDVYNLQYVKAIWP